MAAPERSPQLKLVRIQEKGQVTLPADVRRTLGLKKGDLVSVTHTEDGILIVPQEVIANKLLDQIGQVLKAQGVTLDEFIESGREIRGTIVQEKYGVKTP